MKHVHRLHKFILISCSVFPNRKGEAVARFKEIYSRKLIPIQDASHLMQYLGMCDAKSAEYFGLLAKGDCVAVNKLLYL